MITEEFVLEGLYSSYLKAKSPLECSFVLTPESEVKCLSQTEARSYEFAHIGCPFYAVSEGLRQRKIEKEDLAFVARSFIRYLKANLSYLRPT